MKNNKRKNKKKNRTSFGEMLLATTLLLVVFAAFGKMFMNWLLVLEDTQIGKLEDLVCYLIIIICVVIGFAYDCHKQDKKKINTYRRMVKEYERLYGKL